MKILHTSDWHLGHQLYDHDREEEQEAMLRDIIRIATEERPDIMLVSGDIFHTAQPSARVQRMLADALCSLRENCPDMRVVLTAGNHDSGARHEANSRPWQLLGVTMAGTSPSDLDDATLDRYIISLPGKGFVAAVPYVHSRYQPEGLWNTLAERIASRNAEGYPVVLMAHAAVAGCDHTGHDSDLSGIGGIDTMDPGELADGFDYVALGHIHRRQTLGSPKGTIHYSGSPLAVGFDEAYPHGVTIVTIPEHGAVPEVRNVDIVPIVPLVTLPANGFAPFDEVLALLSEFPSDLKAYVRLNVLVDTFLPPDARQLAEAETKGKACMVCHINARRPENISAGSQSLTVEEFRQESPLSLARRYAESSGVTFDDDMATLFEEAISELNEEDRQ